MTGPDIRIRIRGRVIRIRIRKTGIRAVIRITAEKDTARAINLISSLEVISVAGDFQRHSARKRIALLNLVLSAISLDYQVIIEKVHEKVHETTPKVTFPGSLFCVSNHSHTHKENARQAAGRIVIVPLSGLSQQ